MTAGVGSRATIAPFRAPTLVPRIRSGVIPGLEQGAQHPHLGGAQHPPPPSTNAVVMGPVCGSPERSCPGARMRRFVRDYPGVGTSSGCSSRIRRVTTRSTQKITSGISPATSTSSANGSDHRV